MSDSPSHSSLAWRLRIDCQGCHQLWLADRLSVGSAAATMLPDLPIRGPLSRRHLTLHRGAEAWWGEAHARVELPGRPVAERFDLGIHATLTLGGIQLRMQRPSPVSASATLTVVAPHRHATGFDSVILLHDLCLLGSDPTHHIPCPGWQSPVVLFRQGEELHIKGSPDLQLDGQPAPRGARLTKATIAQTPDLRFHLEPC